MKRTIECERGSGNVFADIGIGNPEEALAKAEIARQLNKIIAERGLTQTEAGQILGIDQPRVSALSNGRLSVFSLDKLMQFASKLGNAVEITIKPSERGGIKVASVVQPSEIERQVLSNAVMGGQNIRLTLPLSRSYRPHPAMKIDQSAMQEVFDGSELMVA
jgi:predicted XRE-type DNA-binding protein